MRAKGLMRKFLFEHFSRPFLFTTIFCVNGAPRSSDESEITIGGELQRIFLKLSHYPV